MPVVDTPACLTNTDCPSSPFPSAPSSCKTGTRKGGVNDLYFLPCTETLSEQNITDTEWWRTLLEDGKIGKLGIGIGSIATKDTKKEKVGSETDEEVVGMSWALKYIIKKFDKTSTNVTKTQMDLLITKSGRYLVVARMSESEESILPIGSFTMTDFKWTVPESDDQIQNIELELVWKELGLPKVYEVAGLSEILPKAK